MKINGELSLPTELGLNILKFMSTNDLGIVKRVSKNWYLFFSQEAAWQVQCQKLGINNPKEAINYFSVNSFNELFQLFSTLKSNSIKMNLDFDLDRGRTREMISINISHEIYQKIEKIICMPNLYEKESYSIFEAYGTKIYDSISEYIDASTGAQKVIKAKQQDINAICLDNPLLANSLSQFCSSECPLPWIFLYLSMKPIKDTLKMKPKQTSASLIKNGDKSLIYKFEGFYNQASISLQNYIRFIVKINENNFELLDFGVSVSANYFPILCKVLDNGLDEFIEQVSSKLP